MNKITVIAPLLIISLWSHAASALTLQEMTEEQRAAIVGSWQPIAVTGDAIPWDQFAKTKEISKRRNFPDGSYTFDVSPGYGDALKNLDGKQVTLMGFMFPLEESDKQKNFLFGPYPMSCPFHYHVGPSQIVEVVMKKPVDFSFDAVTLKGRLSLHYNKETGMFYYLEDAMQK